MPSKDNNDYEFRIVAWLDILGFKEFIKDENGYRDVKNLIDDIRLQCSDGFYQEIPTENGASFKIYPRISLISDTIVISVESNPLDFTDESRDIMISVALYPLRQVVSELQCKLLFNKEFSKHHLCLRGAITVGKIHHDSSSVFGPAVSLLHDYESKVAIYPRVILTNDFISKMPSKELEDIQPKFNMIKNEFERDSDGFFYINFLQYEEISYFTNNIDNFIKAASSLHEGKKNMRSAFHAELLNLHKNIIEYSKLLDLNNKFSIAAKWQWLAEYIAKYAKDYENKIEEQQQKTILRPKPELQN